LAQIPARTGSLQALEDFLKQEEFRTMLQLAVTPEDHAQGSESAPATLVEYCDYECPDCGQAYPIVKQIQKHFGKRLRVVFRNFPLNRIHPHAEGAAEVAEFAGAQGEFWEMHDLLFENQDRLGGMLYVELARELRLPVAALLEALEAGTYRTRVQADSTGGVRSGVHATPTFFVNARRWDGPFEFNDLVLAIDEVLD
jgi:protein-disulfide isomerase